jgi:hypothetical protein
MDGVFETCHLAGYEKTKPKVFSKPFQSMACAKR